ncbi:unknown [Sutterella wadsworthensis CAG:135]|nr:unknown [Sutterella wadsworthensis CAG:135]
MAAAAHHGEIHTDNALTYRCRHDVGVNISACCLNGLLMPHLSERGDAVAQMGGFFKLPGIRSSPHAFFQIVENVNGAAFEKLCSTTTICRISLFGDKSAAGSRTAPDLSQKTGA